jgi:hypothetical protein
VLLAGLADSHAFVSGQADAAADDVEHFLGWRFRANPMLDWHDGVPVPGVRFMLNDLVEMVGGDSTLRVGTLVGLLTTEPSVRYLIDLRPEDPVSTDTILQVAEGDLRQIAR